MNHADQPKFLLIKEDKLDVCYEKRDFNKPMVDRPYFDGDQLLPRVTKGACLGFAILKTKQANAPGKVVEKLYEEDEEFCYPPLIIMLDLEGSLFFFRFFELNWEDPQLLADPIPLLQGKPLPRDKTKKKLFPSKL
jgi:hypothetical protein